MITVVHKAISALTNTKSIYSMEIADTHITRQQILEAITQLKSELKTLQVSGDFGLSYNVQLAQYIVIVQPFVDIIIEKMRILENANTYYKIQDMPRAEWNSLQKAYIKKSEQEGIISQADQIIQEKIDKTYEMVIRELTMAPIPGEESAVAQLSREQEINPGSTSDIMTQVLEKLSAINREISDSQVNGLTLETIKKIIIDQIKLKQDTKFHDLFQEDEEGGDNSGTDNSNEVEEWFNEGLTNEIWLKVHRLMITATYISRMLEEPMSLLNLNQEDAEHEEEREGVINWIQSIQDFFSSASVLGNLVRGSATNNTLLRLGDITLHDMQRRERNDTNPLVLLSFELVPQNTALNKLLTNNIQSESVAISNPYGFVEAFDTLLWKLMSQSTSFTRQNPFEREKPNDNRPKKRFKHNE